MMRSRDEQAVVEAADLYFEYQVGQPVLEHFDLEIARGSICGVLGRNGSGKTTLLQCLYGMLEPEKGTCRVLGRTPFREVVSLRQRVGYVPQTPQFDLTRSAEEQLDFMRPLYDGRWSLDLESSLIQGFDLTLQLHKKVGELSLGQQRQLSLVAALAFEPDVLMLDEPAVSLDSVIRHRFSERVVDYMSTPGRTVVMASHLIGEVERLVDQVVVMRHGRPMVAAPLEHLKCNLLCFDATFPQPFPSLQNDVDLMMERWSGNTLSIAAWQNQNLDAKHLQQILEDHGAESIIEIEPSLERLFVHLAGGDGP